MYIWRGKNRRDKRNLLLLGDQAWTASKEDASYEVDDEKLRYTKELEHVQYFGRKIKLLMEQYLDTAEGQLEIDLLRRELELIRRTRGPLLDQTEAILNEKDDMKKNVLEIFRQFTLPGSEEEMLQFASAEKKEDELAGFIDRSGLQKLLTFLNVTMNEKQFERYIATFAMNEIKTTITFPEFYNQFLKDLERKDKAQKAFWQSLTSLFSFTKDRASRPVSPKANNQKLVKTQKLHSKAKAIKPKTLEEQIAEEESDQRNAEKVDVSWFLQLRLRNVEARAILVEEAVHQAQLDAEEEYRIAHPPTLICDQCHQVFPEKQALNIHIRDKTLHREILRKQVAKEEHFSCVYKIFQGDQGRHLRSNRMIFNHELDSQKARINAARYDPFRPQLSDPNGKRQAQLLRGMFIQGYDAKTGVRPRARSSGLKSQHLAPLRLKTASNSLHTTLQHYNPHPSLQSTILDLERCQDEFIDCISTLDHPNHVNNENIAFVRFQWSGAPVDSKLQIKGEFTGWECKDMFNDSLTGKFTYFTELNPGRYRYRFVADNIETVDSNASKVVDSRSPCGYSNELLVTNGPIYHAQSDRKVHNSLLHALQLHVKHGEDVYEPATIVKHSNDEDDVVVAAVQSNRRNNNSSGSDGSRSSVSSFDDDNEKQQTEQKAALLPPPPASSNIFNNALITPPGQQLEPEPHHQDHFHRHEHKPKLLGQITHINSASKDGMSKRVDALLLRNLLIKDDGCWALAAAIKPNKFIHRIDLSFNEISDEGIAAFAAAIPRLESLKILQLNGNGFGFDGIRYLTNALKLSKSIEKLELCENRLGDDGGEVLAAFLTHNEVITEVLLDSNYMGDDTMVALHDCLLKNRHLRKLSLSSNVIAVFGCDRLSRALQANASLTSLSLAHCPLGPEGAKHIGDLLFHSDTIAELNLCHIQLMKNGASAGLASLCYGIRQNHSLTSLNLQNNGLTTPFAVDIAYALINNLSLQKLDLSLNDIDTIWFKPGLFIKTHLLPAMPSIESTLQRNRRPMTVDMINARQEEKQMSRFLDEHKSIVRGHWTTRRQWKKLGEDHSERVNREKELVAEAEKTILEENTIRQMTVDNVRTVQETIDDEQGLPFVTAVANEIAKYIRDLPYFDAEEFHLHRLAQPIDPDDDDEQIGAIPDQQHTTEHVSIKATRTSNKLSRKSTKRSVSFKADLLPSEQDIAKVEEQQKLEERQRLKQQQLSTQVAAQAAAALRRQRKRRAHNYATTADEAAAVDGNEQQQEDGMPVVPVGPPLSARKLSKEEKLAIKRAKRARKRIPDPIAFINTHFAVLSTFCAIADPEGNGLTLHPTRLANLLQLLAIPIPSDSITNTSMFLQEIVDVCLLQTSHRLALHRVSEMLLRNAYFWCQRLPFHRLRLLADLSLNLPVEEAKKLILMHAHHKSFLESRELYRNKIMVGNVKYLCVVCQQRFQTEKLLEKHLKRQDAHHARLQLKTVIYKAQCQFIDKQQAGLFGHHHPPHHHIPLPSYWELLPLDQLPKYHIPQILDKLGPGGRPLGVVEPGQTVRVIDALGVFLRVEMGKETGWIRYKGDPQEATLLSTLMKTEVCYLKPLALYRQYYNTSVQMQPQLQSVHAGRGSDMLYRVNDNLPKEVQLKVRLRPDMSIKNNHLVVGSLTKGQVVRVRAVLGPWLQIRFEQEDVAWILCRASSDNDEEQEQLMNKGRQQLLNGNSSGKQSGKQSGENAGSPSSSKVKMLVPAGASLSSKAIQRLANDDSHIQALPPIGRVAPGSPIRTRRLDHSDHPIFEAHDLDDDPYKDDLLTFEIDGKQKKVHLKRHAQVHRMTRLKVALFDRLRYGDSSHFFGDEDTVAASSASFSSPFNAAARPSTPTVKLGPSAQAAEDAATLLHSSSCLGRAVDHLIPLPHCLHAALSADSISSVDISTISSPTMLTQGQLLAALQQRTDEEWRELLTQDAHKETEEEAVNRLESAVLLAGSEGPIRHKHHKHVRGFAQTDKQSMREMAAEERVYALTDDEDREVGGESGA